MKVAIASQLESSCHRRKRTQNCKHSYTHMYIRTCTPPTPWCMHIYTHMHPPMHRYKNARHGDAPHTHTCILYTCYKNTEQRHTNTHMYITHLRAGPGVWGGGATAVMGNSTECGGVSWCSRYNTRVVSVLVWSNNQQALICKTSTETQHAITICVEFFLNVTLCSEDVLYL